MEIRLTRFAPGNLVASDNPVQPGSTIYQILLSIVGRRPFPPRTLSLEPIKTDIPLSIHVAGREIGCCHPFCYATNFVLFFVQRQNITSTHTPSGAGGT